MTPKIKINVAVVDDHQLFRQGIISLLKEYKDLNVLFECSNGRELLEQLKTKNPDVIILDLEMPVMDGVEATVKLKEKYPNIKIIILTMHSEEEMIIHLIEQGANGFLAKDSKIEIVVDAIHSVKEAGYYFNDHVSKVMLKGLMVSKKITPVFNTVKLTTRDLDIITLVCKELNSREIAEKLCINHRTVDEHRNKLLKKIGVKNTAGLVMYAVKNKLVM